LIGVLYKIFKYRKKKDKQEESEKHKKKKKKGGGGGGGGGGKLLLVPALLPSSGPENIPVTINVGHGNKVIVMLVEKYRR